MAGPSAELITVRVGFHVHREAMMTDQSRFPALSALTEDDFNRLKARALNSIASESPAVLKRDLLQMIRDDYEENGRTTTGSFGSSWPTSQVFHTPTVQRNRLLPTGSIMR